MDSGDTFVIEDDDGVKEHLHVVLTVPSPAHEVITASISTRKRWSESLVLLQIGEHRWITAESFIDYKFARIRTVEGIAAAVFSGLARPHDKASPQLVRRICTGLLDSDFTPPDVLAYYKAILQT